MHAGAADSDGVTRLTLVLAFAVLFAAGCSATGRGAAEPQRGANSQLDQGAQAGTSSQAGTGGPAGWTVTVYYTAVEQFHGGRFTRVVGCPRLDCTAGTADLGTYPESFVRAVHDEGTGRTTAGPYLNWSSDTGYWLDDAPRDSDGEPLRPFESAAADPGVLSRDTRFTITNCGTGEGSDEVPRMVCASLRAARWLVTDEFTPGLGGPRHVDLYLGEQTGPDFTESSWYTTLTGAALTLQ